MIIFGASRGKRAMFLRLKSIWTNEKNPWQCDEYLMTMRLGLSGDTIEASSHCDQGLTTLPFDMQSQTAKQRRREHFC